MPNVLHQVRPTDKDDPYNTCLILHPLFSNRANKPQSLIRVDYADKAWPEERLLQNIPS